MVAWLGGMPQTIAEPFRDFHRNGFDRYDEERKRYARARSAMESAYSNAKKAAAKKNADEVWFHTSTAQTVAAAASGWVGYLL